MVLFAQIVAGAFVAGVMLGIFGYGMKESLKVSADDTPPSVIACLVFPLCFLVLCLLVVFNGA